MNPAQGTWLPQKYPDPKPVGPEKAAAEPPPPCTHTIYPKPGGIFVFSQGTSGLQFAMSYVLWPVLCVAQL